VRVAVGKQKQTGGYEFQWGVANEEAVLEGEMWMDIVYMYFI